MFAINHAAAALLVKRRFPSVPFVAVLVSVQAMELLWVGLNYLGVERTTTEPVVRFVGDIQLAYMPFSHSVATMVVAALVAGVALGFSGGRQLGLAVAVGILSHLVLDLATHDGDIVLAPFTAGDGYGTWLYGRHPALAFAVEVGFGALCWWVYRGSRALLWVILGFNLANLSLFFPAVPGPEALLAGRPMWLATVILLQIFVTLAAVGWAATPQPPGRDRRAAVAEAPAGRP